MEVIVGARVRIGIGARRISVSGDTVSIRVRVKVSSTCVKMGKRKQNEFARRAMRTV